MKDIDLLYFVEHRDREMDAAAAIAALLDKCFGRSVKVEPIGYGTYRSASKYIPKVVVTPFCPSVETVPLNVFWEIYGDDIHYANLGFEQLLANLFRYSHVPRDKFSKEVAYHCAWNNEYKDWLVENGVPPAHIPITGSPQHTFYLSKYKRLLASREEVAAEIGINAQRKWAFFPFNYGGAFYGEAVRTGMLRKGQPPEMLDAYIKFCRQSFDAVMSWLLRAAHEHRDTFFIIRPRPLEEREVYLERIRSIGSIPPNIIVVKRRPIRDWIANSDIVFSSFSTTLLDALVAGKNAFSLLPYPLPEWLRNDWNDLIPAVRNSEEFTAIIANSSDIPQHPGRPYAERKYGIDQGDAISRVAILLNALIEDVEPFDHSRRNRTRSRVRALRSFRAKEGVKEFLVRRGWSVPGISLSWTYDYFDSRFIKRRVAQMREVVTVEQTNQPSQRGAPS